MRHNAPKQNVSLRNAVWKAGYETIDLPHNHQTKSQMKSIGSILTLIVGLALLASCSPFSDLQTSRMTGKGEFEVTPFLTTQSVTLDEEYTGIPFGGAVGTHLSYGLTEMIDLRLSIRATPFGIFTHIGPKFRLIENRLAFFIPAGTLASWDAEYYQKVSDFSWELQPTLLFSQPVIKDKLEWNLSGKYIHKFNQPEGAFAVNTSFSFGKNMDRRTYILEYGIMNSSIEGIRMNSKQISFGVIFKI
jgi:hypothetical protein